MNPCQYTCSPCHAFVIISNKDASLFCNIKTLLFSTMVHIFIFLFFYFMFFSSTMPLTWTHSNISNRCIGKLSRCLSLFSYACNSCTFSVIDTCETSLGGYLVEDCSLCRSEFESRCVGQDPVFCCITPLDGNDSGRMYMSYRCI